MTFIPLDVGDLALAAVLVLINAGLSFRLRLGIERQLLVAAVRMTVQLFLLGLVLKVLFAVVSPWWTALAALTMIGFAGREAWARQRRKLAGWWAYGVGTTSMFLAGTLVTVLALTTQVRPDPWYHPRWAIPLLGMILGNTMTGVSLGLSSLNEAVVGDRSAIEAQLALGASYFVAVRRQLREALRNGFIPIINSMAATGLVTLPGMMTGQILSGIAPEDAIKYQILIMFLIAGGTGLGTLAAVLTGAWRLSDDRDRLRVDRLHEPAPL